MAAKPLPSQSLLNQLLRYEPETGKLFWKERPRGMFGAEKQSAMQNAAIWNGKNAGKEACSETANGYLETSIFRRRVLAHRAIWKIVHGVDPQVIDHIDGDKRNNRIENLRNVSQIENGQNHVRRRNNTSGVMGVRWDDRRLKWHTRINLKYRSIFLGYFVSFDDAVAARKAAEIEYGFHQNHGRAIPLKEQYT